ncbi:MAG TPA: YbhB/YbcL family Raf kinase inhibitor-like protein [Planctomycetaceae bacterium]|nr:YbhB/YbcL family Raf kinase inhibitor-like protein [Planctomycetaceae bacterium]
MSRFLLSSPAFAHGEPIPAKYTEDGLNVSPPMCWEGVPDGTRELALLCEDPDAPTAEPWVHWIVYQIAPSLGFLPEDLPPRARLQRPVAVFQGRNSWHTGRTLGYRGPDPPYRHGAHRYVFRMIALDAQLKLNPGADRSALLSASAGHVLAETVLVGTYSR